MTRHRRQSLLRRLWGPVQSRPRARAVTGPVDGSDAVTEPNELAEMARAVQIVNDDLDRARRREPQWYRDHLGRVTVPPPPAPGGAG